MTLYRDVADELAGMIRGGTMRVGDKLPSVREFCRTRGVSPATVLHAYDMLTAWRLIESRSRSGFYVAIPPAAPGPKPASKPRTGSTRVAVSDLVFDILQATRDVTVVPLGSAFPEPSQFPWATLARSLGSSARRMDPWSTVESLPPGDLMLRQQIARRYLRLGMSIGVEQIIVTSGALEALTLALETVARRGDTIAIESPCFYGCLQAAERLGVKVVEIPTAAPDGIDLGALTRAIAKHSIRACWLMTTLQHPTGATAPNDKKRELVRLLTKHGIPLIEDDAYAELQFHSPSPPAKAHDRHGWVLHCGSFSKCLAPGYRLGWVAAGRFTHALARRKLESSIATSLPVQQGIAQVLRRGGYDAHLVRLRRFLAQQQREALASLRRHFPPGYQVIAPPGGYFLWVQCAPGVDALEVHRRALERGISVAPGVLFSPRADHRHCLRLNYGHAWTSTMDKAVGTLGLLLRR